jgi:hypothetical protein
MKEFPLRYTRINTALRRKFVMLLAENGGIVKHACRDLSISPDKIYQERKKNPKFRKAWEAAIQRGIDRLEDEAKRRALDGHEEPIYYKGELCGYRRVVSDSLLALILKAYRSNHGRQELTGPGGTSLNTGVVIYLPDNGRVRTSQVPKNGDRGVVVETPEEAESE